MILLDTNICIAHLNGDDRVFRQIEEHRDEVGVSSLVVAELFYGFLKSVRVNENIPRLRQFLSTVRIIDFDLHCAEIHGEIKLALERIGKPTGAIDALIAAVAVRHDATLVTNNVRHFENVPELRFDNWLE